MKIWIFLLFIYFLLSCSTGSRFYFQTEPPRAEIYAKTIDAEGFKKIGITPVSLKTIDISPGNDGSGPLIVELRKAGYKTKSVLITEMSAIDLTITRTLEVESGLDNHKEINWVIDNMFNVKLLVDKKDFGGALLLIRKIKNKVPQVSAVYELEGGIYFLKKNYKKALESYRLAARYNPKNPEVIRMRDLLEKKWKYKDSFSIIKTKDNPGGVEKVE